MERFFRIQEQQRRSFNDLRDGGLGWRVNSPHGTASSAEEDARSQLSYQTAPRTGSSRQGPSSSQSSSSSGPVVHVPGVQPVPVPPPLILSFPSLRLHLGFPCPFISVPLGAGVGRPSVQWVGTAWRTREVLGLDRYSPSFSIAVER
jgi:hypothetical protein